MLIGQYTSKLTEGNRLAIPKKFREELGGEMIIAKWYEGSLVLVSKDNWQSLLNRLTGKEVLITSPVRDIDRFVMGSAYEVNLDSQGRFVMPEALGDYTRSGIELVFVGLGDRVEIWPQVAWQKLEEKAEEKASKAIEKIAKKL
jgi:MraZ protein